MSQHRRFECVEVRLQVASETRHTSHRFIVTHQAGLPPHDEVAESADVLGLDRSLAIEAGSLLAIMSAGAYAMAMASNYNSRPRPCEVLVDAGTAVEIRARERVESLFALERGLPKR